MKIRILLTVLAYIVLPMLFGAGMALALMDEHPQDEHVSASSEWYFQERAMNDALRGKVIKEVWATGESLTIVCDGATFEYRPVVDTKVTLLPRGTLTRE